MFFSNGCQSLLWIWLAIVFAIFLIFFAVVDVHYPLFTLDVAFFLVDVALDAFLDDNFVVKFGLR